MQQSTSLTNNLMWFLASLGLAFFVWLLASSQADPVEIESFSAIPVQYQADSGLIVTSSSSRAVTVNVRAQRSVMNLLTDQDITVRALLQGVGPGTQVVALEAAVAQSRRAVLDTKPAQVTVTLERERREQKPVEARIISPPPVGFIAGTVTLSETQVLVTGVESRVEQVAYLEAPIDLSDDRNSIDEEIELIPVDANGQRIAEVTVAQPVRVNIEITQDEAIELVFVTPNVNRGSLPSAYVYLGIEDYNPKTVSVTGDKQALANLPDTLQTELIDLSGAEGILTTQVGVQLPEGVFLVEPEQLIEVKIVVEPREDFRQLNNIPVEVTGENEETFVRVVPNEVTVLIRGPQPIVRQLTAENVRVVVDVQGLATGNHDLEPITTINLGQIAPEDISVLPNRIGVSIETIEAASQTTTEESLQPKSTAEN